MTLLTNITLRKKIALLTILGLFLAVGVFSYLGIRAVNQATEAMLQDRLTTARLIADYLDEALGQALNELSDTAEAIENQGVNGNISSQIEALEDTYSHLSIYIHGIYLIDEQGRIIWSQPEATDKDSVDISVYPSISQTIRRDEAGISGLVGAPITNIPVILLTNPIKEKELTSKKVIVVAVDFAQSRIGGFVRPIRLGQTGYVEIIDQNGIVVARTEPGPELASFEKSDHSGHFAALIDAGEPTRGRCHTCHEHTEKIERKDILAFVPLSTAYWGVVIRQSEEEALAPINELRQNLILFGAGLIMIAFLFVVITTRDIVSRIKTLTNASQRIAGGDLVSPLPTLGKDELGILAYTFDDMRAKLKIANEELERIHRNMQRKDEIRGELLQAQFTIQEEERKRIARELHDETSQVIASITANLEVTISILPNNMDKAKAMLRKMQAQSINILKDIHKLIYELRPTLLDDLGLVDATRWLLENNLETLGIIVNFKTKGRVRQFDNQLMTILFRVTQEVVNNIAKHATANRVDVSLRFLKSSVFINIKDDGIGFDVEEAINTKDRPRGLGIIGMMEKVELAHGTLNIRSRREGGGTEVKIEIPLST